MPDTRGKRVRVSVSFDYETFHKIDSFRNPELPRSEFYAMVVTEALGINQ